MKKLGLLIFGILLTVSIAAQNPFNLTYGLQNHDVFTGNINYINGKYLLHVVNYDLVPTQIMYIDSNLVNYDTNSFNPNVFAYKFNDFYNKEVSTGIFYDSIEDHQNVLLLVFENDSVKNIYSYGGSNHDRGNDLVSLQDSGYIIVGSTESFGAGGSDIYIIRTDKYGDTIWTKTYGNPEQQVATNIVKENDSTLVVAGGYENSSIGNSGPFVMKINLNGDTIQVVYNAFINYLNSLIKTNNNEYVLAGRNSNSSSYFPSALTKLDNNLNVIWSKQYRDATEALDVKQTSDNGYILVGYAKVANGTDDDIYVVKTDANGDTLWTKEIGGPLPDVANSVIEAPDGSGYVIAGYTYSWGNGGSDAFLLKLKPNGDLTTSIGLEISSKYLEAKVFPNPTSEEFNLKIDNYSGELQMEVIDISGKSIYKENLNIDFNFQESFKLNNLSSGVYSIRLKGYNFETALKLVVE